MNDALIGAVIGLARACEGNEDILTEETFSLLREGLSCDEDNAALIDRLHAEKMRLVPRCQYCAAPCGRNNDFDMNELSLYPENIRELKRELLTLTREIARSDKGGEQGIFYCKAMLWFGMDSEEDKLTSIISEAKKIISE